MKIQYTIISLFFLPFFGKSQQTTDSLTSKLDSILIEANLLYQYEKVAWHSTDILLQNPSLSENIGGYLVYQDTDSLFAIYLDSTQQKRIAKYTFSTQNVEKPIQAEEQNHSLSQTENTLLKVKHQILNQLSDPTYAIGIPEGFNPNFILLPGQEGYRFYILMGPTQPHIIPMGNDYVFFTDEEGNIKRWQKFHSRVIPIDTQMPGGGKMISAVHSHLKGTPYITASDICTFRLYGPAFDMNDFMVLSTALNKYFIYHINTNTIEVTEP